MPSTCLSKVQDKMKEASALLQKLKPSKVVPEGGLGKAAYRLVNLCCEISGKD